MARGEMARDQRISGKIKRWLFSFFSRYIRFKNLQRENVQWTRACSNEFRSTWRENIPCGTHELKDKSRKFILLLFLNFN